MTGNGRKYESEIITRIKQRGTELGKHGDGEGGGKKEENPGESNETNLKKRYEKRRKRREIREK
jgi:hypothetical protein